MNKLTEILEMHFYSYLVDEGLNSVEVERELKAAEQDILSWADEDVIGEDEEPDVTVFYTNKPSTLAYSDKVVARNLLRAEQRKRARQ